MSTRAGEFMTLREVMDEVGKDVGRFCFMMRSISSHLDFDLDAVKKESMDNPGLLYPVCPRAHLVHPRLRAGPAVIREVRSARF